MLDPLGCDIVGDGILERALDLWRAIMDQREIQIHRERVRLVLEAQKCSLGFLQLPVGQAGDCRANTGLGLHPRDFEDLALGDRLGAGRKVFANAFSVQLAGNAEDDFPRGILEF